MRVWMDGRYTHTWTIRRTERCWMNIRILTPLYNDHREMKNRHIDSAKLQFLDYRRSHRWTYCHPIMWLIMWFCYNPLCFILQQRDLPLKYIICNLSCDLVLMYMLQTYMYIRGGMKIVKQHSKLRQQKRTNIQWFAQSLINFYQCCSNLDWMPPKLNYCYMMSTRLVPIAVSTWI